MSSQDQTTSASADQTPSESPAPVAADAILTAVALDQAATHPDIAVGLRSYMESQERYIAAQMEHVHLQKDHLKVQMEHLHEQRRLTLTHMRHQHFSDWLSSAWKVLLVILGTGVLAAAGWLVWDAKHDNGLVIEAFQVPEDFAAKGYTGTVVAERVLDHLKKLQADSSGFRAASAYTLNWGTNLKVEIPETGVSLGELVQYLHERFGHQTRISGELVHMATGVAMQVRSGEQGGERVEGTESELDSVIERAAEKIYARTQPYRYASVLFGRSRTDEGIAVLRALGADGRFPATERAWAYDSLAIHFINVAGDFDGARRAGLAAIRLDPKLYSAHITIGAAEWGAGHDEAALSYMNQSLELWISQRDREDVDPAAKLGADTVTQCMPTFITGDGKSLLQGCFNATAMEAASATQGDWSSVFNIHVTSMVQLQTHDVGGALTTLEIANQLAPGTTSLSSALRAQGMEDWIGAAHVWPEVLKDPAAKLHGLRFTQQLVYTTARAGDLETAQKLIDVTPTDCYGCIRARGQIAALKKDWPTAERWFSEAAKQGPSLPFANTEWGQALLDKGDTDHAIAQFEEAIKRQAHFADPYQYWGEALLAEGDARGAINKFEQAVKYAPKWGRIQIQWGAALKKLGRDAEAQQKFAAAEAIELVPSERALLSQVKGV